MTALDVFLLLLLLATVLLGMWRGLIYELLSVAGWMAAFALAQWQADRVAAWLPLQNFSRSLRSAAGFIIVFVIAAFVAGLLASQISRLAASVGMRPVDRVLGAAFGLLRGVVMLLALAVAVNMTNFREQEGWRRSFVALVLDQGLHALKDSVPYSLARYFP